MSLVDAIIYSTAIGATIAFAFIVWNYGKGLKDSPRELWLLFGTKLIEYTAYAATNMTFILWLSADCGLGDVEAGAYISSWSLGLSVMNMIAGALVDAIGIRKTLLFSTVLLIIARFFMIWLTNPVLVMLFGFVPLALGFAIVAPVISVGIKRYTTKEGAALGFGLFYVLMNVGFAVGGWVFDDVRDRYSLKNAAGKILNENAGAVVMGYHLSTYQLIMAVGFVLTFFSATCIFFLRDSVELKEDGTIAVNDKVANKKDGVSALKNAWDATVKAAKETVATLRGVMTERMFWHFIMVASLTVFVRFIFFHFHYTFPKYGVRVLGEGAKIGSIYGVLNPVLIVFLVPLVASMTKKVASYKMLVIGTLISSLSVFLAAIPGEYFASLNQSWLGEIIFVRWLDVAPDMSSLAANPPSLAYWPMIFFILIFTIGEAIWSPRLMQFTAEIAPEGKEGTYLALSVLPFFAAKFVAGPMSGLLVKHYTPVTEVVTAAGEKTTVVGDISNHYMIWVWIGGMAILSPILLMAFRRSVLKFSHHTEQH